jgi:MFS transporter, FHS family, glucose/mannose:H+ symporter
MIEKSGSSRFTLLTAATISIFVYGMIASVAGSIVPQLSARMHLTPAQIGNLFLTQAAGMMIASMAFGPLVDARGKKAGMLASLAFIMLALVSFPQSSSLAGMFSCMTLLGLGGGGLTTTASTLLSDINPGRRAAILTVTKSSYGVGGFLTPMIGATLLAGNTIALCYVIAALAFALLGAIAFLAFPPPSMRRGFHIAVAAPLLSKPLLYLLSLTLFFYVACEVGMFNWLPKYLIARGLAETVALRIVSLGFALGLLVGRLAFAAVLLRASARFVAVISAIVMTASTAALLLIDGATMAGIAAFIAGLAMAPMFPSVVAIVGDCFPRATATAMGIAITSGWAGLAVSSRLIGAISSRSEGGVATGMLVLPAFSAILILLTLWLQKKTTTKTISTTH